jgi:hypothetical protein
MRIEDGRCDDPISGAKIGGEPAGHAEADHAAVALADGARNDVRQVASGVAANDQHAGSGGDLGFKAHADKRNDDAVVMFERKVRDRAEVVALIEARFGESWPGASSLTDELSLSGELSFADELSLGSHRAIAPR